ncbi:MAG: Trk system potassium transporter TrkA [Actinomycetia bacterium]|nr:Trk system potassium transporter TrkA [Actinomycetes bacterium]
MRVIVVGAGEVGTYVADRLSRESHDVALIESDPERVGQLERELDVLVVQGDGTHPSTLKRAGIDSTDLLVAVTSVDSVNLVASMVGKQAGVARSVVRLESSELRARNPSSAAVREAVGADLVIDPDEEVAQEVLGLLEYPGASEVAAMADGEVTVIGARLPEDAPLVGRKLSEIAAEYEPNWDFLFGAITRGNETIIPRGDQTLQAHDLVRVVAKRRARRELAKLMGLARTAPKRVMLLGGGRTAELLAQRLPGRGEDVTIVERNPERARVLAERLDALVLQGEVTDADLLLDADVGSFDAVIALTGEDDANVLACLFAKQAGATETIAILHRLALLGLLTEEGIDGALSPRTATANAVLRFVRGDVAQVATFLHGQAEVVELIVSRGSPADGSAIADLDLPHDVLVGAIVRDGKAQIGRGRSQLRARDHVIVFAEPEMVDRVRKVFG